MAIGYAKLLQDRPAIEQLVLRTYGSLRPAMLDCRCNVCRVCLPQSERLYALLSWMLGNNASPAEVVEFANAEAEREEIRYRATESSLRTHRKHLRQYLARHPLRRFNPESVVVHTADASDAPTLDRLETLICGLMERVETLGPEAFEALPPDQCMSMLGRLLDLESKVRQRNALREKTEIELRDLRAKVRDELAPELRDQVYADIRKEFSGLNSTEAAEKLVELKLVA